MEKLKTISDFVLMIGIFLCIGLLIVLFIQGGVWLSKNVLPYLVIAGTWIFIFNIIILLPLAIFKKTRGFSAICIFISSYLYGIVLWLWSFILTYVLWGAIALIIGLFFMGIGVIPLAIIACIFNGMWPVIGQLIVLILLTFGSRMFAIYLAGISE